MALDRKRRILLKGGLLGTAHSFFSRGLVRGTPAEDDETNALFRKAIPFSGEPFQRLDTYWGAELDGRLFTDLSFLREDKLIVPSDIFYVRTRASRLLPSADNWALRLRGSGTARILGIEQLDPEVVPLGPHLMECAGNTRAARFGLIGVAGWMGIPLTKLLEKFPGRPELIVVSGFDTYSGLTTTSATGASWVFTQDQIESTGAFLATHMNGSRLTADHGGPYRLIVPGWYGCAAIKWVNEIAAAGRDFEATSQMREYASRTWQAGIPALAREYTAPFIEAAAMPTRVELWRTAAGPEYRIEGLVWGGVSPLKSLEIGFLPPESYVAVDYMQTSLSANSWRIWRHRWRPSAPGRYQIRLRNPERSIASRRLDQGYYFRNVEITET